MSISGHKTRSMFDRYNIANERDQREALRATEVYRQQVLNRLSAFDFAGFGSRLPVSLEKHLVVSAEGAAPTTCNSAIHHMSSNWSTLSESIPPGTAIKQKCISDG